LSSDPFPPIDDDDDDDTGAEGVAAMLGATDAAAAAAAAAAAPRSDPRRFLPPLISASEPSPPAAGLLLPASCDGILRLRCICGKFPTSSLSPDMRPRHQSWGWIRTRTSLKMMLHLHAQV
jgi:hypothetical protein